MSKNKKISLAIVFVFVLLMSAAIFFVSNKETNQNNDNNLKIVSSFSIIGSMVEDISGSKNDIYTIVKPGDELHEYELNSKDLQEISDSNIIFTNGFDLEESKNDWKKIYESDTDNKIVELTSNVKPIYNNGYENPNPHAWLSIKDAKTYYENIYNELSEKDPHNKDFYKKNYDKSIKKLNNLNEKYYGEFNQLPNNKKIIITQEASMSYFARNFDLKNDFIEASEGEESDNPMNVQKIINVIKSNNIKNIFSVDEENKSIDKIAKQLKINSNNKIFTDSVSENNHYNSYFKIIDYDAKTVLNALKK